MGNGLWEPYGTLKGGCCSGPNWRVVMKRSLATNDPSGVQFRAGSSFPVAFAVWDGSNVERAGMKAISTWFTGMMPYADGVYGGGGETCMCECQNGGCSINCCP